MKGKQAELADLLFDLGAIKFGEFRLKLHETQPDAPLSPIFLNLRTPENPKPGPLTPEALDLIADLMFWLTESHDGLNFTYVAGIPNAGDPVADALMTKLSPWPRVKQLHLGKTEVGGKRLITGVREKEFVPGRRILLVDDLITQAHSKFEAIRAAENDGLQVRDLIVVVDRLQGGKQEIESAGYRLHTVMELAELLDHYVSTGRLEADKASQVLEYVATNQ